MTIATPIGYAKNKCTLSHPTTAQQEYKVLKTSLYFQHTVIQYSAEDRAAHRTLINSWLHHLDLSVVYVNETFPYLYKAFTCHTWAFFNVKLDYLKCYYEKNCGFVLFCIPLMHLRLVDNSDHALEENS